MDKLPTFERLNAARDVEVQHGIKLIWQRGEEVVAPALRLRQIDHADGAFEPLADERRGERVVSQRKKEARNPEIVKERLVASGESRSDALSFGRTVPVRCCRDRAGVGRKA